ncbi:MULTISPECIES: transcription antitermination factor NusB [Mesotoga]|uniref:transcription antitermination factor NusB n=3 Tax=Kosmotogaceae TaxID=1643948 RepID=UPI0002C93691|nr:MULTISPECIES: transcription antitermination factor NusB [Mesotoga]MDK2944083.1 transcription antitermination protein NusB [Mesotoga sp.]CCU86128.1 N utilization substance protein B homolog [Mesotoga infera]RLL86773.1 antitermination protein NusB [Mesotoga sp. H07pep.5.4]HOZ99714.1 transcription antitermination factor NusB [Mesotoga prima]HQC15051.1 transcription antitermination factor NusB [Mesotoga prima]
MTAGPNKSRRKMREIVFSAIYQFDFNEDMETSSEYLERELSFFSMETEMKLRTRKYFDSILRYRDEIDSVIRKHLTNWTFERLASTDKNVLRLGAYEIIYEPDIPIEVTLNEAIDIAKKYGSEQGGKFVNGVLDRIARECASTEKKNL